MKRYENKNGNSGVTHYEISAHAVTVKFKGKPPYIYSETKISKHHIDQLKVLAKLGKGLGTYINQHEEVKKNYISG